MLAQVFAIRSASIIIATLVDGEICADKSSIKVLSGAHSSLLNCTFSLASYSLNRRMFLCLPQVTHSASIISNTP